MLQEIEARHGLSEFDMKQFIRLLYGTPFPDVGSSIFTPQESASSSTAL